MTISIRSSLTDALKVISVNIPTIICQKDLDFGNKYCTKYLCSQELQIEKQKHEELLQKYTDECKSSEGKVSCNNTCISKV